MNAPLPLGTKTEWGTIEAISILEGERYYWMIDKYKCVSMIPDFMVEVANMEEVLNGKP